MCLLFGRDKSVISRHIKNVILENNLDVNQVVAKNATTGNDGKTYIVSFYNLDVIIPLGYKVHSQNGIMFRKWANSVLKEYLLKGYVINENRTLITNESYVNLINKVNSIDKRLSVIEKTNLGKKSILWWRNVWRKIFYFQYYFKPTQNTTLYAKWAEKTYSVESITLNKTEGYVYSGIPLQLKATISPENASDKTLTWTSSNPNCASVSNTGLVTLAAMGQL